MRLFDINQQIRDILDQVDEDGCLPDGAYDTLESLKPVSDVKIEAIACLIKEKSQTAKMIKEEVYAMTKRQKAHEKHAENLKTYLANCMTVLNVDRFESAKASVSFRKSAGIVIDDSDSVPQEYYVVKDREISKDAISEAIKAGVTVPGAHMEERRNIAIK